MPFIPLIAGGLASAAGASTLVSGIVSTGAGLAASALTKKKKTGTGLSAIDAVRGKLGGGMADPAMVAQRRTLADEDAERNRLMQEKAAILGGGRPRRRGSGLSTYSGAF